LKNFGAVTDVTFGQYESPQSNKWTTTDGKVNYKKNADGTYTITVPKFSVVNVSKKVTPQSTPQPTNPTNSSPTGTIDSSRSDATTSSVSIEAGATSQATNSSTKASASDSGNSSFKKVTPFKVMAVKPIYQYQKPTFKKSQRVKYFAQKSRTKAPVFTVIAVSNSNRGRQRYQLSNGHYITAKSSYVVKLYLQGSHQVLRVVNPRGTWSHSQAKFTKKNAIKHVKKSALVKVKKVIKTDSYTRYQLMNGTYITGNKQFVKVFK
jgi:hypothetical protein